MTQKSLSRRQRDASKRQALGGAKLPNASTTRQNTARCWIELKNVHARSSEYISKLGMTMSQYAHPLVLMKIAKSGDTANWSALHKELQEKSVPIHDQFQSLWDRHKDNNKLCYNPAELGDAMTLFDAYQAFDMHFFETFSPIINGLNEIYNKALKELIEAKDRLAEEMIQETTSKLLDPTVISDVPHKPVVEEPAAQASEDAATGQPAEIHPQVAFGQPRPLY